MDVLWYCGIHVCFQNTNHGLDVFQISASAQEADDDSAGNLLDKAGKLFHQHKTQLFSLIGLEEGKEEEFLTKTLEKMNIDSGTITQLTDSFKDQDSVKTLISTFSNPDKLPDLLAQQTGMNEDSISSFVNQVKDYIPRYKYKFKGKSYVISFHVFSATDPPNS